MFLFASKGKPIDSCGGNINVWSFDIKILFSPSLSLYCVKIDHFKT